MNTDFIIIHMPGKKGSRKGAKTQRKEKKDMCKFDGILKSQKLSHSRESGNP